MKQKFTSTICLFAILTLGVFASAIAADRGPDISNDNHGDSIHIRAGQLPAVNLTPGILYHILVAEFAAQRGDYITAANGYSMLSKLTLDPRLAKLGFQAAMMAGDIETAYNVAKQWELLDPTDPEASASSMALAARSGNTDSIVSALQQRIQMADNKHQAIGHAFMILSKMPDKSVALEVMDKVIPDTEKNTHIAHVTLADLAYESGDSRRAYAEAQAALKLKPESEMAIQRVIEYGFEIEPQAVVAQADKWLQRHPDSRKTYFRLLNQYVLASDFDAATASITKMRARWPEDFDLLFTDAEINIKAQNYEKAKHLLNEYISVQEQRRLSLDDSVTDALAQVSDARFLLASIAERQENTDQAIEQLDKITEPGFAFSAQMQKAVLQARQGNISDAKTTIDKAKASTEDEQINAALTMASIYRNAGRSDDALQLLVKTDLELPNSVPIKYDLAMLYVQQGKTDKFDELMRAVIRLDPENANAYNSLGYTYVDQNRRLDEARELLEYALELDPNSPYILDSVGWYFFRVNDLESALMYLQRAYALMPDPDVAAHYGEVLWLIGDKDRAREVWLQGYQNDANNDTLLKTIKKYGIKF